MKDGDRGDRFGRFTGGLLIAEGLVVAALRVITLVYLLAREAYVADRFRTPLPDFIPWLLTSVALVTALEWAGSLLLRTPEGAWSGSRVVGRVVLVTAAVFNLAGLVWAVSGLIGSPASVSGLVSWLVVGLVSATAAFGVARDALRRRPSSTQPSKRSQAVSEDRPHGKTTGV